MILSLPKVEKRYDGSPLILNGNITFDTSDVQSIERMHHSWWWTRWETLTAQQPNAACNRERYKKAYPTAIGGEDCTLITFKCGTTKIVKGITEELSKQIFKKKGC